MVKSRGFKLEGGSGSQGLEVPLLHIVQHAVHQVEKLIKICFFFNECISYRINFHKETIFYKEIRQMNIQSIKNIYITQKSIYTQFFGNSPKTKSKVDDCLASIENELQVFKTTSKPRKPMKDLIWNTHSTQAYLFQICLRRQQRIFSVH